MSDEPAFDVAIVGGGMVGAALACALGGSAMRVAVLQGGASPAPFDPAMAWEQRVSAVTRSSQAIFTGLGAWQGMVQRRVSPFREMHVWDDGGVIHFDSAALGEPVLGHIVENGVIRGALEERLGTFSNVTRWPGAQLLDLHLARDWVRLETADQGALRARLVVAADGARSRVRDLAGIAVRVRDFAQQALVATVRTSRPNPATAWQRFLPGGPLAFLPLRDGQSSIVWSMPSAAAERRVQLDDDELLAELQVAFGTSLGRMIGVGPRASFALRGQHAASYVRPRVVLVGDAAHTIHPLAGQGLNLGLLDGAALAEVLREAVARGRDPGELGVLRRYERWRKGANRIMETVMEGFHVLFGTQIGPLVAVRRAGLNLTNGLSPVKGLLSRYAMGLEGDLPRLARGLPLQT